ncbi:D-alanyl-D-alanine carboxypeptidase family protein [Falsirhodobacter halotolerans]|uniref:D-alanyl-D-alanine carboxypeptidase family protein n=1 Tax=Falsirhodobacter halotolerans TaxID=1146892 RepID=UPI001FD362EA|nr:D-alanyl-D-alanine carboxypeptidase family protein [Falsirhodobacter halotolerans]MCJ8140495.1 D-alanyl-D-alanine carboxypeptidase [Falsirhodobacter halotolerans]
MGQAIASLLGQYVRFLLLAVILASGVGAAQAAPYAAYVMDARTGETLYSTNADTRLHPASLTKMMTLYIAFQHIKEGKVSLDTMITVSRNAASQPPSRLGLRAGQKIALRYLIRAAAVKSGNDAASAIGDALGGDEATFAAMMNRTAKALGMNNSTFVNANGLTRTGHMSTAHDMSILGRHLLFDFPEYYNLFSRRSTDAGMATVANTNRRFLDAYEGADGIKTGYTSAAGFNLTASALRGNSRIIATVFGGTSTADRNARMAKLLDMGFERAPRNAPIIAPTAPGSAAPVPQAPVQQAPALVASAGAAPSVVASSLRPQARPGSAPASTQLASAVEGMESGIASALQSASTSGLEASPAPAARAGADAASINVAVASASSQPLPFELIEEKVAQPQQQEMVATLSTSGGRHWGVNVGRFNSSYAADRAMTQIALAESATLNDGLRKIVQRASGYDANIMGLTQDQASLACRRLRAKSEECFEIGP